MRGVPHVGVAQSQFADRPGRDPQGAAIIFRNVEGRVPRDTTLAQQFLRGQGICQQVGACTSGRGEVEVGGLGAALAGRTDEPQGWLRHEFLEAESVLTHE